MKLFVYGTLKRGGVLHQHLNGCEYYGVDKISGFSMYQLGWFPAVKNTEDENETIYGEVYEIDKKVLKQIDRIEGKGVLYERNKCKTRHGDCFIYVYKNEEKSLKTWNYPKVPHGFFEIPNKKWKISIGDDLYKGDSSKVVFDMRFFDTSAGRCDTNKQYMRLYKERTWDLDINTSVESVFLTDLMIQCNLEEI